MGEEGAAPGGLGVGDAAGDDLVRQPAHRPAAKVDQPGLPGQPLAVLGDPHEVAAALAQAAAGDDLDLGAVAENLGDLLAQAAGRPTPVSSSASMTMCPPTRCSAPANRSIVAISAARADGLGDRHPASARP